MHIAARQYDMHIGIKLYRPRLAQQWPDVRIITLAQQWPDAA